MLAEAIEIVNALGQKVYNDQLIVNSGQLDHHIKLGDHIANGVYFLKLATEQQTQTIRFTVER